MPVQRLIIALDISLKNTGYAVLDADSDDGNITMIESGHVFPETGYPYDKNIGKSLMLMKKGRELANRYYDDLYLIAAEMPFVANSGTTTLALAGARTSMLVGMLDAMHQRASVPIVGINNISVKTEVTGNHRATKWWTGLSVLGHLGFAEKDGYTDLIGLVAAAEDAGDTENKIFKIFIPYLRDWGLGHWKSFDVTDAVAVGIYAIRNKEKVLKEAGHGRDKGE